MRSEALPEIDVTLRVDGRDLHEYQVEDTEEIVPTTTAFVEAVIGAKFSVQFVASRHYDHDQDDIVVEAFLDGTKATGVIWEHKHDRYGTPLYISGAGSMASGIATEQPFTFAELKTVDGVPKASEKEGAARLGEITVKLVRCRVLSKRMQDSRPGQQEALLGAEVSEKALKGRAMSSRTKLGKAQNMQPFATAELDYRYGKETFAVYTFRYRSHRDLQIEGLLERSPTPVPLEDRNPEDLTPDEARELVRRMRNAANVKQEFKREKRQRSTTIVEEDGSDNDVTFTSENRRKRTRVDRDSGVEIVDLT